MQAAQFEVWLHLQAALILSDRRSPDGRATAKTSRLAKIGGGGRTPLLRGRWRTGLGEGLRHCSLVSVLRDFESGTDFFGGRCVGGGYWIRARALRGE